MFLSNYRYSGKSIFLLSTEMYSTYYINNCVLHLMFPMQRLCKTGTVALVLSQALMRTHQVTETIVFTIIAIPAISFGYNFEQCVHSVFQSSSFFYFGYFICTCNIISVYQQNQIMDMMQCRKFEYYTKSMLAFLVDSQKQTVEA